MTYLTTVPTFTFRQGSLFNGDTDSERPITVEFYNGCILLKQEGGGYTKDEQINIHPKFLKAFCKEIQKRLPEAEEWLARKS